jgi:hypothetical protein
VGELRRQSAPQRPAVIMSHMNRVEPTEAFDDHVLVRCPACDARAVIDARSGHVRLTCSTCGLIKETKPKSAASGPLIPYSLLAGYNDDNSMFGARLWLETTCCGGRRLWALNQRHLEYMDRFVRSKNREREFPSPPGNRQLADKLPAWMTSRKHREDVSNAIAHLRSTL